jgi:hypothetical protein
MKHYFLLLMFLCVFTKNANAVTFTGNQSTEYTVNVNATPSLSNIANWQSVIFTAYNSNGDVIGEINWTSVSPTNTSNATFFFTQDLNALFLGQYIADLQVTCTCDGGSSGWIPLNGPLPITLSYFLYKGNTLYWKTDSEINVSHFDIESSQDGITYEWENEVSARNSSTGNSYEKQINTMNRYYRLKAVDFDKKVSLSEPLFVRSKENQTEPINHGTSWTHEEDLFLFNSYNGLIKKSKNVSLENLPAGIYFLKWNDFSETIKVSWPGL